MTPSEVGKKVKTLPQLMRSERANALRRVVRTAQRAAVDRLTSRGFGRALAGKNNATVRGGVKTVRVKTTADSMRSGIEIKGIPALIELGGRTKAHDIKPKTARALSLKVLGGAVVREVHHPGSRVPKEPFLFRALEAAKAGLPTELEKGHRRAIAKAGLQ